MRIPNKDMMSDYKDSNFGSIISTMLIEGKISGSHDFELGDSDKHVTLYPMIPGPVGMDNMKADCHMVRETLEKAIPKMSGRYKKFWEFMAKDFDDNGVKMPVYGRIL